MSGRKEPRSRFESLQDLINAIVQSETSDRISSPSVFFGKAGQLFAPGKQRRKMDTRGFDLALGWNTKTLRPGERDRRTVPCNP